jgi:hypothetical protein
MLDGAQYSSGAVATKNKYEYRCYRLYSSSLVASDLR